MLTKAQVKEIRALHRKKERNTREQFLAEGLHTVEELILSPLKVMQVITTHLPQNAHKALKEFPNITLVSQKQMEQLSTLKTPPGILAVIQTPKQTLKPHTNKPIILLDDLQDPGNTGTIIRTAHWFGISQVVCSHNNTDPYGPKTVQATMGSIGYVNIHKDDLEGFMKQHHNHYFFAGLDMHGTPIQKGFPTDKPVALIVGSEVEGIAQAIKKQCHQLVHIPPGNPDNKPQSLNASIAAGIAMCFMTKG